MKTFSDQDTAIAFARDKARKDQGKLYIHASDGSVRGRDNYANEASPPGE